MVVAVKPTGHCCVAKLREYEFSSDIYFSAQVKPQCFGLLASDY